MKKQLTKEQRKDLAYEEYHKITDPARIKYHKIIDTALKEYDKKCEEIDNEEEEETKCKLCGK